MLGRNAGRQVFIGQLIVRGQATVTTISQRIGHVHRIGADILAAGLTATRNIQRFITDQTAQRACCQGHRRCLVILAAGDTATGNGQRFLIDRPAQRFISQHIVAGQTWAV